MLEYLPENASTFGSALDAHLVLLYWFCTIWFILAVGVLFYLLIRYRERPGSRAAWVPGNTWRAAAWVLIPAAAALVCDLIIEFDSDSVWAQIKVDIPEGDVEVTIRGSQFQWEFIYPGPDAQIGTLDDITSRELHVPVDQVIRFNLEARDVLHAFFVPELRLKHDAVPGRSIPGWFEVTREGTFTVACAELCGAGHTLMQARMVAQPDADFQSWLAEQGEAQ